MIVLVALAALVSEPAHPRGWYVEARTAAVFAGACHHGAQSTLIGREALLTWHVDAGGHAGVDLAGLDVTVLVRGNANLGEATTVRESWIFVEDSATEARTSAAAQWLARDHAAALGTVRAVRRVPLSASLDGDRYRVSSPGLCELAGSALPDRACCSMPQQVWYRPFAALDAPLVGLDDEFRVTAKEVGVSFSRPDENGAILGRFGGPCVGPKSSTASIR